MMKLFKVLIAVSLLFACLIGVAQKNSLPKPHIASDVVPLDRIVAVVNNQVITSQQLKQAVDETKEQMIAQHVPVPPQSALQRQVLNAMIDRSLQLQYAKKMNIQVSDDELNEAILSIAKSNHLSLEQLRQSIISRGVSYQEYRHQIRNQLIINQLQQRVIAPQIVVTDQEIKTFLQNYAQQSNPDTEYRVHDILIPLSDSPSPQDIMAAQKRAQQLANQIRQGANFEKLAAAESAGNEALQGGDLGWRKAAELPTVFAEQVVKMRVGQSSNPIRAANGFHILKLVDVRNSAKKLTTDEIRQFIFEHKLREQLDAWLQQLHASAYIKIMLK